jgi:hypothetical protein
MVSYRYTPTGKLLGYTKSTGDIALEGERGRFLLVLGLILAPFLPLLAATYFTYRYLNEGFGIHPLFSGILSVVPTLLGLVLLVKYQAFRYLYFGLETLGLALFVFAAGSDKVWAGFFALIILIVGGLLTHFLANLGFDT